MQQIAKAQKKYSQVVSLFALLGSASVTALRKTLVKSTLDLKSHSIWMHTMVVCIKIHATQI